MKLTQLYTKSQQPDKMPFHSSRISMCRSLHKRPCRRTADQLTGFWQPKGAASATSMAEVCIQSQFAADQTRRSAWVCIAPGTGRHVSGVLAAAAQSMLIMICEDHKRGPAVRSRTSQPSTACFVLRQAD